MPTVIASAEHSLGRDTANGAGGSIGGADVLEVGEARRAGQLGLGDAGEELPRAGAALALLDRGGLAVGGDLAVEHPHQPALAHQLACDRQSGVSCEPLLVGADLDPSGAFLLIEDRLAKRGCGLGERLAEVADEQGIMLMLCDRCAIERSLAEGEPGDLPGAVGKPAGPSDHAVVAECRAVSGLGRAR
ncbi:MAG TPA: hypothetical protein VFC52_03590 [Solirubrobacterales bacterium]|nr:hypothetical protein [Solirubrobacterales bacterium]